VVGGKIVYVINKRGSDDVSFSSLATAVDSAFGKWRLANGSVVDFVRDPDPSTTPEGTPPNHADRRNVVYWDEDPRNGSHIPNLVVGFTIRDINIATGEMFDADVVLNAAQFRWTIKSEDSFTSLTGSADVQEALTRAVGQLLGLNNVPTRGSAMQSYTYSGLRGRVTLGGDDFAAALEGLTITDMLGHQVTMRKDDHQILTEYFVGVFTKGVKYDSEKTGLGWKTETTVLPKDLDQPNTCNMKRPSS